MKRNDPLQMILTASLIFSTSFSSGAVVTVGAGETLQVNDGNVADYADGIAFADASGTVTFATSSAPTMPISGAGTVKKTYSGGWTMTTQIPAFTGDYVLEGGGIVTVASNTRYYFGAESEAGGALVIKDGNTLYVPNTGTWALMGRRRVRIAGTGYGSMGAVNTAYAYNTSADFIRYLVLDDDATFYQNGPGYYNFFNGASIDLNGHELTFAGNGSAQLLQGTVISTNGSVRVRGTDAAKLQKFAVRSVSSVFSINSPHEDSPIVLDDFSQLHFYLDSQSRPRAVDRHLRVDGSDCILCVDGQSTPTVLDWSSTNLLAWAGPVDLNGASSVLTLYADKSTVQLNVTGRITGEGSLVTTAKNVGRVYLAATNNAYTGSTYFNNAGNVTYGYGSVLLAAPGSVPDYSSLTTQCGFASVRLKEREHEWERLWDGAAIASLANKATWLDDAAVGLDTTYCDGEYVMAYPSEIAAGRFIGGVGPGDVAFTNVATSSGNRLDIVQGGGVLRIAGDGGSPVHVGRIRVLHPATNAAGSAVLFDGCDLVYDGESEFQVNFRKPVAAVRARPVPRIRLKDTRLVAATITNAWDDVWTGTLAAGYNAGEAAIEILSGCVITSRIVGAGRQYSAHGAFYQRGGSVTVLGNESETYSKGSFLGSDVSNGNNHGFYELSGGEMTVCGRFSVGLLERALFLQKGGTMKLTKAVGGTRLPVLGVGNANGYGASLCVLGGTFDASAGRMEINSGYGSNSNQFATVSAAGPTAYIDFGPEYNWVNNADTAETLFTVCDGGVMRGQGVHKNNASSMLVFNFDDGTFIPTENGNAGAGDIFHTYGTDGRYPQGWTDHVVVYAGGMTIDTDGKKKVFTRRPIEGAAGAGVSGVTMDAPIRNICGAPIVRIVGDGYGAVGVAEFDSVSNTVTGVRILAPGVGYTYARAKMLYGREEIATYDCTLAANVNAGGFTKKGEGSFVLYATNTWGGATAVAGGTLEAGCDWALPAGTDLVLSGGGVMDFNGKTGEVASVTYGPGGGSIVDAAFVRLPSSASVVIDVADLLAGKSVVLDGDVDLDSLHVTLTGDTGALDEDDRRYTLVQATGTMSGTPRVSVDGTLPKGWSFKTGAGRLRLSYGKCLLFHIR